MKLKADLGEDASMDMSPMIDMVFLLLIFFLVASNIVKEQKIPVQVPEAIYSKVTEDETGRFEVTVTEKGDLFIKQRPVTLEELTSELVPELAANPKLKILLRADGKVHYKVHEEIMEACAKIGAENMVFTAFEKDAFIK
jgi:biopolymer transport protein ExbD